MLPCWSEDIDAYTLPQDLNEPKAVFWIRHKRLTNDEWMVVQAAVARLRRTLMGEGKEDDDPIVVFKCNEIEREAAAKVIDRIENVRKPSDAVRGPAEILLALREMDFGPLQTLLGHIIGTQPLRPIERKPSGSQSEGGQPSPTLSDSELETSPTP